LGQRTSPRMQGGVHLDDRLLSAHFALRGGRRNAHLQAAHYRQLLNTDAASCLRLLLHDGEPRVHLIFSW
jgi:hypothetical protein